MSRPDWRAVGLVVAWRRRDQALALAHATIAPQLRARPAYEPIATAGGTSLFLRRGTER